MAPYHTCSVRCRFSVCPNTRQSKYRNGEYLCGNLIYWCSRRIKTVVTNNFASEYIAASYTAHYRVVSQYYSRNKNQEQSTIILEVCNNSVIDRITAIASTRKYKYIIIRFHHVQKLVTSSAISIIHQQSWPKCLHQATQPRMLRITLQEP